MHHRLEITASGQLDIVATRTFDAPRARIWDCHTKPELVQRWLLGPEGWTMPLCAIDLQIGGKFRYVWRHADGRQMTMSGVFREIVAPARLVHTEQFNDDWTGGETVVTQTFTELGGKTTLHMTVSYSSAQARDAALATPMASGMEAGYARLEKIVEQTEEELPC